MYLLKASTSERLLDGGHFFEPSFVLGAGKGRLIDYCSCSIQDDIAIMIEEDSIVGGGNHQYISIKYGEKILFWIIARGRSVMTKAAISLHSTVHSHGPFL